MIYSYADLLKKHGSYYQINKALKKGAYFKVSHGLYSDQSPYIGEVETIFLRYPKAVLTLQSAFAFYDMSDFVPNKYIVATTQKAHKIDNVKVEQIYITDEIFGIGIETIKTKYGQINIYDKERMLIELFRLKSKLGYDYFRKIINSYRRLFKENAIDNHRLLKYCLLFKNGGSLLKKIQEVVL